MVNILRNIALIAKWYRTLHVTMFIFTWATHISARFLSYYQTLCIHCNTYFNFVRKFSDGSVYGCMLLCVPGIYRTIVKNLILSSQIHGRPLDVEYISLLHCIHNDNIEGHFYRGYTIIGMESSNNNVMNMVECGSDIQRSICFVFSGLGSQWSNICKYIPQVYTPR